MAEPICLPDTLSCYFENIDDCCVQWSTKSIDLNRVYNSQVYWNSDIDELNCYGCTTAAWTYQQLHFFCELDENDEQVYRLQMCMGYATATRQCSPCTDGTPPPTFYEFDLVSFTCDPFEVVFRILDEDFPPCCEADDDCDPDVMSCDIYATITE